jgi:hypothetical protein
MKGTTIIKNNKTAIRMNSILKSLTTTSCIFIKAKTIPPKFFNIHFDLLFNEIIKLR